MKIYMLNFIHSYRSIRNAFALTCDADGREVREKKDKLFREKKN